MKPNNIHEAIANNLKSSLELDVDELVIELVNEWWLKIEEDEI